MNPSFEQALIEVWRQALIEDAKVVELGTAGYPVLRTSKRSTTVKSDVIIAPMRTHDDPSHWNLVSLTIGALGLALAGLLLYAGAHFVLW